MGTTRGVLGGASRRRVASSRDAPDGFLRRYNVRKVLNGTQDYVTLALLDRLNESLTVLTRDNSSLDSHNNKMYTYALMNWRAGWEPILEVVERHQQLPLVQQLTPSAVEFLNIESPDLPSCDVDGDCPSEFTGDIIMARASVSLYVAILLRN